jgi:hypothetical protein
LGLNDAQKDFMLENYPKIKKNRHLKMIELQAKCVERDETYWSDVRVAEREQQLQDRTADRAAKKELWLAERAVKKASELAEFTRKTNVLVHSQLGMFYADDEP